MDYYDLITSHMIKVMMENDKEKLRKEAIALVDLTTKTAHYLIKKTLDISTKVRLAVYKKLLAQHYPFENLNDEDKV